MCIVRNASIEPLSNTICKNSRSMSLLQIRIVLVPATHHSRQNKARRTFQPLSGIAFLFSSHMCSNGRRTALPSHTCTSKPPFLCLARLLYFLSLKPVTASFGTSVLRTHIWTQNSGKDRCALRWKPSMLERCRSHLEANKVMLS